MTSNTSFTPNPNVQPYSYKEHYLKVEDSKGKTLFTQTFETKEALDKEFENIKTSKQPYSFTFRTVFPARCDSVTNFFKSIFVPNTLAATSSLSSRVAKIALGLFTSIFDLMTLPVRTITAIPYIIYDKFFNKETHKIIEMISNNPDAFHALSEGKVVVRKITEDFSHIQPGTIKGTPFYVVKGTTTGAYSDVYIIRRLDGDNAKKSGGGPTSFDGCLNENVKSMFRAFQSVEQTEVPNNGK